MAQIVFLEGIPGAGKSLLGLYLAQQLRAQGAVTHCLEHTNGNPLDITKKAFLSQEEYDALLQQMFCRLSPGSKYSREDVRRALDINTTQLGTYRIVSYTQIWFSDPTLTEPLGQLSEKEFCHGRVDLQTYCQVLTDLFCQFGQTRRQDQTYLLEGALLENILIDLVGHYCLDLTQICSFYQALLPLLNTEMTVCYLQTQDVRQCLSRAASHRGQLSWMTPFTQGVLRSPWMQKKNISNKQDAAFLFCQELQALSLEVLRQFPQLRVIHLDSQGVTEKCLQGESLCPIL